ncbi:protein of unknown function [Bartonella clarridgeiae 73]|uniref:Uncharacterized protein n=1 Tax=Bartonella clarridgeiae (strain CCUG 45776 / CIP 104772 / 73) TaxID=696125 RepID=E6YIM1_BARC7|nr:protein of unknown function [Bartonella clarridgeiae 73]
MKKLQLYDVVLQYLNELSSYESKTYFSEVRDT